MSISLPKIFLDSGDPEETRKAKGLIGTLDGQTTNPSLLAKNPDVKKRIESGSKLTEDELMGMYQEMIQAISQETAGPISVEVYADFETSADQMLAQAEQMYGWAKNVVMKFPTIPEGLKAAHRFTQQGGRVNMTLVFDQQQAAAVYEATRGTATPALLSPFMGRWDDRGYNGVDLIKNIHKQYRSYEKKSKTDAHVKILAASIRNLEHLYASIFFGADAVTMPLSVIRDWIADEKWVPDERYRYEPEGLKSIIYEDVPQGQPYDQYPINYDEGTLLAEGMKKFSTDWKNLVE
jgi:transaldolase